MALYAFDGTWNSALVDDEVREEDDTNVVCFFEAYQGRKWYVPGPGTRRGRIGKTLGGVAGAGARGRLEEACKALAAAFRAGDSTIDIVGFSRGAAIALDFANLIHDQGVRDPDTDERIAAADVEIRFVGLWDTVGAFGVPYGQLLFQRVNLGHKLRIPANVQHAYHALAMDERRQAFRPTRQLGAYEVWFRGVHSDVGGGNGNAGLAAITLRWMLCKAQAVGLPIAADALTTYEALMDPNAALVPAKDFIPNGWREFWDDDRVHYSASDRDGHNNAPAHLLRESAADEQVALACAALPKRKAPKEARVLGKITGIFVDS